MSTPIIGTQVLFAARTIKRTLDTIIALFRSGGFSALHQRREEEVYRQVEGFIFCPHCGWQYPEKRTCCVDFCGYEV